MSIGFILMINRGLFISEYMKQVTKL